MGWLSSKIERQKDADLAQEKSETFQKQGMALGQKLTDSESVISSQEVAEFKRTYDMIVALCNKYPLEMRTLKVSVEHAFRMVYDKASNRAKSEEMLANRVK